MVLLWKFYMLSLAWYTCKKRKNVSTWFSLGSHPLDFSMLHLLIYFHYVSIISIYFPVSFLSCQSLIYYCNYHSSSPSHLCSIICLSRTEIHDILVAKLTLSVMLDTIGLSFLVESSATETVSSGTKLLWITIQDRYVQSVRWQGWLGS